MILNSFAVRAVAAASPRSPRKCGSNAGTYCLSSAAVSRSGSTVMNSTCTRSASGPRRFIASASVASVAGQTSGHCVYPKKTTTALPRKSASVRVLPFASLSAKSWPNDEPVTSDASNEGPRAPQATSASVASPIRQRRRSVPARDIVRGEITSSNALPIVIDQQRGEECGEIDDREAEHRTRQPIAVRAVEPHGITGENAAERDRRDEIGNTAHPHRIRHQRDAGQCERVEHDHQLRVADAVRIRQHRQL